MCLSTVSAGYFLYSKLLQFAIDNDIQELKDALDFTEFYNPVLTPVGTILVDTPDTHDSCVSFVSTNYIFFAGCDLPGYCGSINIQRIATTWYGSEMLFCYGSSKCDFGVDCGRHKRMHLYYNITAKVNEINDWINSYHRSFRWNGSYYYLYMDTDSFLFHLDRLRVVSDGHYYKLVSVYCTEVSLTEDNYGRENTLLHAPYITHHWDKACVTRPNGTWYRYLCAPIAEKVGRVEHDSLVRMLKDITYFYVYPLEHTNYTFPITFFRERYFPTDSSLEYTYLSPLDIERNNTRMIVYQGREFSFGEHLNTTKCFNVHERYYDPVSGGINKLFHLVLGWMFDLIKFIENNIEYFLKWVIKIVGTIVKFVFDILSKIPLFVPFVITYIFIYILWFSHVVSLTISGFIWLVFLSFEI
uniref:Putative virion glycoprotein N-terminal domain-containing protein n=1 Tax=Tohsystermes virus TaxID=2796635 RepID=A0A7T7GV09_9VIRU|nr:hypothetical protein 2 [Tohsystermes virus]